MKTMLAQAQHLCQLATLFVGWLEAFYVLINFHSGLRVQRVEPWHSAGALHHGGVKFPKRAGGGMRPAFHLGDIVRDGDAIKPVAVGAVAFVQCFAGLLQRCVAA